MLKNLNVKEKTMPRLTISLPQIMHNRLSSLSVQQNDSLSNIINNLLQVGMHHFNEEPFNTPTGVEKHCQHLIIQMNALIKNLSSEILKFNQDDFEQLRKAALSKYNELIIQSQ